MKLFVLISRWSIATTILGQALFFLPAPAHAQYSSYKQTSGYYCPAGFTRGGTDAAGLACGDVGASRDISKCCRRDSVISSTIIDGTPYNLSCGWEPRTTTGASSEVPYFCVKGFNSQEEARQFTVAASCPGCLAPLRQALEGIFGATEQKIPIGGLPADFLEEENGKWGVCIGGFLDSDVLNAVEYKNNLGANIGTGACTVAAGAGSLVAGASGVGVWSIPVIIGGGVACTSAAQSLKGSQSSISAPIRLELEAPNSWQICNQSFSFEYKILDELTVTEDEIPSAFQLCSQSGPEGSPSRQDCEKCSLSEGVWTGVGCIPYSNTAGTVRALMTIGLGLAGTVVVLMTLAGGFMLSTSKGDPQKVEEAKSLIVSAVSGILFLIFSVTILRFVGVTIFRLPGFG